MKKPIILSIAMVLSCLTCSTPASQDIRKLARERLERQKGRLQEGLAKAIADRNRTWLETHKTALDDNRILSEEDFQIILNYIAAQAQAPSPTEQAPSAAPRAGFDLAAFISQLRKTQLREEYEQACQSGNLQWIIKSHQDLLAHHIVSQEEFDETLEALNEPMRKKQELAQERAEREEVLRMTALKRMQTATSDQEAVVNGLAWLCEQLSDKQELVMATKQAGKTQNLEELFKNLDQLTENQNIMAVIGKELQQLRGHMLYRVWAAPQEIASNKTLAMQAFREAMVRNDFNAIINLYRDAIQKTSLESEVMNILSNRFIQAIEQNDTTTVVDLYLNFFKGHDQEEASLLLMNEYAQNLFERRNLEALQKLRVCFEHTQYMDSLLGAITSLQIDIGIIPSTISHDAPQQQTHGYDLWNEWQTACINRNLERLLALREQAIQNGIVDADVADAIIESIM